MDELNLNIEKIYSGSEMLPYERLKLYTWIQEIIKPKNNILETGCGCGGSTYYLASSLKKFNQDSLIYTCDPGRSPSPEFFSEFKNVKYYKIYSNDLINYIIKNNVKIDYVFFDGPEDPNIAFDDIKKLEDYIESGCYFSMHDWETQQRKYDNGISTKALFIREYMENSDRWEEIEVLNGIDSDESVGMCLYKFIK